MCVCDIYEPGTITTTNRFIEVNKSAVSYLAPESGKRHSSTGR